MIELPEAITIARQMNEAIKGKRIKSGTRGNAPHKFAFYSRTPEEYEALLPGLAIGEANDAGTAIVVRLEPDYSVVLGEGGERILLHQDAGTLPKKHQLSLEFDDGTFLTVSVQGWGAALLLHESELATHPHIAPKGPSPVTDGFTLDHFLGLFDQNDTEARSVKYFIISRPGVWGVGNGYLQDILFRARIHPRRRAVSLTDDERRALYEAIRSTLKEAVELGGRHDEFGIHGDPGGYRRILDSKSAGGPCPRCGTTIEKISFLGGACYFCPKCQA